MLIPIAFADFEPNVRKICVGQENPIVMATFGPGSYLVSGSLETGCDDSHVLIGRYSSLGHRLIFLIGLNHDYHEVTTYPFDDLAHEKDGQIDNRAFAVNHNQILIGNDVWIGCDVTIMGGVRIGNGAVIGAGSVIAKDVPPYAVVVGNPARVIKYRFTPDIIDKLQQIKWWNWSVEKIQENRSLMKDVVAFTDRFIREDCRQEENLKSIQELEDIKGQGKFIYYFVPDFSVESSIWDKVISQYLEQYTADDAVVLLLGIDNGEKYDEQIQYICTRINDYGENAPMVMTYQGNVATRGIMKLIDAFITTKEEESSQCLDYIEDAHVHVLYGLDYQIFRGK